MYKPDIHVFISPGKKLVLLLILEVYITIAVHLCMCYPTPLHSNLNIAIWENNKVYEAIYDWAEALFSSGLWWFFWVYIFFWGFHIS